MRLIGGYSRRTSFNMLGSSLPGVNLLGALVCALALVAVAHAKPGWKVFSNRAGWSISYPGDWKLMGCKRCSDPASPDTPATLVPGDLDTDAGIVRVDRLEDKPADVTSDAWFVKLKTGVNLNERMDEMPTTVNALPALKVLYCNRADGTEIEQVYVLAGSQTFSISFGSTKSGATLTELPTYATYQQMLASFHAK